MFADIAHQSTDFHFPDIDVQINAIRQLAQSIKRDLSGVRNYNGSMTIDENGLDVPSSVNSSSLSDFSNDGKEPGYNLAAFRGGDSEGSGSELGPAGFLEHSESVVLPPGMYVTATITLYPIGRPVRATITLYPIGRPVRATITLYSIGMTCLNYCFTISRSNRELQYYYNVSYKEIPWDDLVYYCIFIYCFQVMFMSRDIPICQKFTLCFTLSPIRRYQ